MPWGYTAGQGLLGTLIVRNGIVSESSRETILSIHLGCCDHRFLVEYVSPTANDEDASYPT
jgi:hypothetical protein